MENKARLFSSIYLEMQNLGLLPYQYFGGVTGTKRVQMTDNVEVAF